MYIVLATFLTKEIYKSKCISEFQNSALNAIQRYNAVLERRRNVLRLFWHWMITSSLSQKNFVPFMSLSVKNAELSLQILFPIGRIHFPIFGIPLTLCNLRYFCSRRICLFLFYN